VIQERRCCRLEVPLHCS